MSEARIEKLEEEISSLRELLTSITLSVHYRKDMAFEASLSYNQIAGQARTALTLVLGSIQSRVGRTPKHASSSETRTTRSSFR